MDVYTPLSLSPSICLSVLKMDIYTLLSLSLSVYLSLLKMDIYTLLSLSLSVYLSVPLHVCLSISSLVVGFIVYLCLKEQGKRTH